MSALLAGWRYCGTAGGGWPCCLWPEVAEQGPGAPGAIGLGREPDLGFEAAVVRLRGLPAESGAGQEDGLGFQAGDAPGVA